MSGSNVVWSRHVRGRYAWWQRLPHGNGWRSNSRYRFPIQTPSAFVPFLLQHGPDVNFVPKNEDVFFWAMPIQVIYGLGCPWRSIWQESGAGQFSMEESWFPIEESWFLIEECWFYDKTARGARRPLFRMMTKALALASLGRCILYSQWSILH